jgi:hypothetical protein
MADPKISDSDAISSADHSEAGTPANNDIDEKDVALQPKPKQSLGGRRVSEWEALQIVAAGDIETIDREVDEIEADLQAMDIRSTWFKPQLRLKNPRHFTWLLVGRYFYSLSKSGFTDRPLGFASMGGLLSGVDQSLISGANLYMPSCESRSIILRSLLTKW